MATIVTLANTKYYLIEVQKGAKVPAGVEAIRWHDGKDYILSPVETPVVTPVTTEDGGNNQRRTSFPWWLALLGLILLGIVLWLIFRPCTSTATIAPAVGDSVVVDSNCYAKAAELHAPADTIKAICDPVPGTNGVSLRLTSGTKVSIGTITFDAESRVWFLQDFTVPSMANYAFEYKGAERQLFSAPFVVGSELGYGKNGERIPFTICWDVTSEGCVPPVDLFPTK